MVRMVIGGPSLPFCSSKIVCEAGEQPGGWSALTTSDPEFALPGSLEKGAGFVGSKNSFSIENGGYNGDILDMKT